MTVCALYWLCSLRIGIIGKYERFGSAQGEDSKYSRSMRPGSILDLSRSVEFLSVGGLSGSTDDYGLFLAAAAALSISAILWVYLVWVATDPGAVCSRTDDFDMVSTRVFAVSLSYTTVSSVAYLFLVWCCRSMNHAAQNFSTRFFWYRLCDVYFCVFRSPRPSSYLLSSPPVSQILNQSLLTMGPPSDRLFCCTSFVRKPTR